MLDQFRYAARTLAREPSFTLPALLTLALGIGASVAVFSVIEAVLLRPLPYPSPDRVVLLRHRDLRTNLTKINVGSTDLNDVIARQQSFETVLPYNSGRTTLYGVGDPVDANALAAGPALFEITGVKAHLGRGLAAEDCRQGAAPVVVLGYEFWQKQFGSDEKVLGRTLTLGAVGRQVVGIAPPNFRLPPARRVDVILPFIPPNIPQNPRSVGAWILGAARLKPAATLESAVSELKTLSSQLATEFPGTNQGTEYFAVSVRDSLVGDARQPLILLMSAVSVVLLIAFVNVGNLLLVRATARRGDLALRVALGAERSRLFTQLLAEHLLLALVAGAAGLLLAQWGTSSLVALVPESVAVPALADVGVNVTVLGFTLLVTLAAAIGFSVFAAAYADGQGAARALASRTRHSMSRAARRTASTMVVIEVALAVILLVGAGLILRSFAALLSVDAGFDRRGVTVVGMSLPAGRYNQAPARAAFYDRLFPSLNAINGVESVGTAAVVPLTGNNWTVPFERVDRPLPPGQRAPDIGWQTASGGYFPAMRIPLKSGRVFRPEDATGPLVVVISESVAKRFFDAGETVIGHRVKQNGGDAEIVGVVGDIRRGSLTEDPRADMYFPFERGQATATSLFFRSKNGDATSFADIRNAIRAIEPNARVEPGESLDEIAAESASETRLVMWLLSVFSVIALALATIGVYGVLSYAVRQRMREFGTRVALGASGTNILWLVMRQGTSIVAIGLVTGLAVAMLAVRLLQSLMYSVRPYDPASLGAAALLLGLTTFIGCYVPARRAARVQPSMTLAE